MSTLPLLLTNKPEQLALLREKLPNCQEAFDLIDLSIAASADCKTTEEWVAKCMELDNGDIDVLSQYREILKYYKEQNLSKMDPKTQKLWAW